MRKPVLVSPGPIVGGARVSRGGRASTRWFGTWCAATLCWAGFGGAPVLAGELALGAGYSLAHDSNISRVPYGTFGGVHTEPIAEWTQSLIGGFAYQERTGDFNARLLAQAELRDYLRNTYVDEKAYYVNGAAVWTIVPRQFTWHVDDLASQVPINLAAPDTPNNRTNVNSLSTGPDFTLRLNPADSADIGARYGRIDIQGPGDNERSSAYARWVHQASTQTNLSVNYETTRVNFQDSSFFSNYLLQQWFLRYELRPSPSGIAVEAGITRLTLGGQEQPIGRYGRLTLLHQLNSESSLRASLESRYADASGDMLGGVTSATQPVVGTSSPPLASAITDVYYSKRGELAFDHRGSGFQFAARGYARSVVYQQSNQSFDESDGYIECTWFYSPTARIRAYADYLKRAFLDFVEQDRLRTGSVSITFRLNPNVNLTVEGARIETSSTVPVNNFVDRRAVLSLSFSTGALYVPQSRR
jgi:hypothetical protein